MLFQIKERDAVPGEMFEVQGVPIVGLLHEPTGFRARSSPTAASWAALLSEAGPQFQALAQRRALHGAQLLLPQYRCRSQYLGSLQGCRPSKMSSSRLTCLCQTTMFKRRLPPYWQACSTQVGHSTINVVPFWQIAWLLAAAHLLHW